MSEASRFGSLAQRVRAAMGQGDTSIIALASEGGGQGGQDGSEGGEAGGGNVPVPPAPAPPPPPAPTAETEKQPAAATVEEAVAAARTEERERFAAVFASEASNGKERVAAKMLGNPKLSAEDIIGMLPDCAASASDGMLERLASTQNPDLAPGAEAGGDAPKASARILAAQRGLTGKKPDQGK